MNYPQAMAERPMTKSPALDKLDLLDEGCTLTINLLKDLESRLRLVVRSELEETKKELLGSGILPAQSNLVETLGRRINDVNIANDQIRSILERLEV